MCLYEWNETKSPSHVRLGIVSDSEEIKEWNLKRIISIVVDFENDC